MLVLLPGWSGALAGLALTLSAAVVTETPAISPSPLEVMANNGSNSNPGHHEGGGRVPRYAASLSSTN